MNNSREKLLDITFDEIYQNGYNASSVDKILKKASMNKGSLYHFFKSKKELVLCVVEEKLSKYIEEKYSKLLNYDENICEEIIKLIKNREDYDYKCGCRVNNLIQELSSVDKDFQLALEKVYFRFENIFEQALNKAVNNGEIRKTDTKALAMYIVASIEGCLGTAKKSQDGKYFYICISQLELFLKSFKNK